MRLFEFRRTTAFRSAMLFFSLFGIVTVLLFGYLYFGIVGFEQETADSWLRREQGELITEKFTDAELITRFEHQRQYDPLHQRPFGLYSADGTRLAGGYPGVMPTIPVFGKPFDTRISGIPHKPTARCMATRLASGSIALQCQNTRDVDHFDEELLQALITVGVLTLLIGGLCAAWIGRTALHRMTTITDAIKDIVAGNLSSRIPVHAGYDDVNRLAGVVNGMLDEIERLMHEVKGVCDAIAHDLRTPLTRALAGLERVQRREADEAALRAAVDQGLVEMNALLRNFNALLRISEIENSQRRSGFTRVDLGKVVEDVYEFFEPSAEEKDLHISLVRPDAPMLLSGDPSLLFEAIANLVENAIKFTPNGGHVRVMAFRNDKERGVRVSDDGPGVPVADREAVFRRFYRGEESRHTPGNGLGLSLAAAVASMHGMRIYFEETKGCSVVLSMPL